MPKMTPKIIHYCWFGRGTYPNLMRRCIRSWKKILPDYIIKCWNEDNFNIDKAPVYVRDAYKKKKFAFVSDYVRLYALYTEGGVYLDTDVEVLKDFSSLLNCANTLGYEGDEKISTAFIASEPKSKWIGQLLDKYNDRDFIREDGTIDMTTNVSFISDSLRKDGIELNGQYARYDFLELYPQEYFSPRNWEDGQYHISKNTYTIHHFAGSWHSTLTKVLSIFFSNATVYKIAAWKEKLHKIIGSYLKS